ncbi:MAG: hypothetical protein ACXVPU_10425 [Bacteroidia bacterium]
MKSQLIIILTLLMIKVNAQCGREYPSGFYHNSKFITSKGDTLNNRDSSGFYEGMHLYTDNPDNLFGDTNSYVIGKFQNGLPVGDWKDHCKDGTYSVGQYETGAGESSEDGKGGWIIKYQGIYDKIGVWKFYDKNNNLFRTERYDRLTLKKGWINKTYVSDRSGHFVLIKLESKSRYQSVFRKEITKVYSDSGILISKDYESHWRDISIQYYDNGKMKEKNKCRKIFGIDINRAISKSFSEDGKLKEKQRGKCHTIIVDPAF